METLPLEILITIFDFIPWITDKRRVAQTCKKYNSIIKEFIKIIESHDQITYNSYPNNFRMGNELCRDPFFQNNVDYTNEYCVEKFTLELCHDNYLDLMPMEYLIPENKIITTILILFGKIELLKIALINGCKLNKLIDRKTFNYNSCDFAVIGGHIDILQLVRLRGCEWDGKTCKYAAYYGHLNVIRFLIDNGCEIDMGTCVNAAKMGHLHILEWWKGKNIPFYPEVCAAAASHGHLDIIKWLFENGCECDENICIEAAKNGHLDIIKWAIENNCNFDVSETYFNAALANEINIIKWMRESNYNWDEKTCRGAAQGGHLKLLKWLIKKGCKWNQDVYVWSIANEKIEIMDWLIEFNGQLDEDSLKGTIKYARNQKKTKIITWLENNKYLI